MTKDLFGHELDKPKAPSARRLKGRFAEFMVCAYLTRMGHYVTHVDTSGFDLVLDYEGEGYRIEVKSTSRFALGLKKESVQWQLTKGNNFRQRARPITPRDADLVACYHLAFDSVIFVPVLRPMLDARFPANQVRLAGDGRESLATAIEQLRTQKSAVLISKFR